MGLDTAGGPVTETDAWPEETPPSMARVFDHYLGGTDNTVLDREYAAEVDTVLPRMGELCRGHRAFSAAAVDHFARAGIDQFLELGAGLPTVDHVHARAFRHHRGARVVYVDNQPVDVEHARSLVAGIAGVSVLRADVGDPTSVLASPEVAATLDLTRPVAVLACGVLHYLDDATALAAVRAYRDAIAAGSGLAISHLTGATRPDIHDWATINHGGWSYAPRLRGPDEMAPWLEGFDTVAPGWVSAPHWTPDGPAPGAAEAASGLWGVVARRKDPT
jgi:O-methyltransferase involved in polyketide biosynthesis